MTAGEASSKLEASAIKKYALGTTKWSGAELGLPQHPRWSAL